MTSLRPILPALLVAIGCSVDAFVSVSAGPVRATATLPVAAVPASLLTSDRRLVTLACDAATPCPSSPSAEVVLRCEAGACALAPFTARSSSAEFDLDADATFREYAAVLRGVAVQAADLRVTGVHAGNVVGPLSVWWGPPGEATPSQRLGSVPRTPVTGEELAVPVTADAAGVASLSAHVFGGTHRFRVRVEGAFEPGTGVLPDAEVGLNVQLRLRLETSL